MRNREKFLKDLSTMINQTNEMLNRDFLSEALRTKYGIEIQTKYILNELTKKLQRNYKETVEAQIAYDIFYVARQDVFIWVDKFCHNYNTKTLICKLRKCKSWEEVINLEHDFIELAKNLEFKIMNYNSIVELNSCFYYYVYLIFLSNTGVCAIIDSLYNELELDHNEPRAKFDYFNEGMPLTTIPIAHTDISIIGSSEVVKESVISVFKEFSNMCEESFNETGSIKSSILSNSKYLALITACTRTELSSEQMDRVKFRKTIREYIHLTELIALALYEADVNIENEDYIKLATFKEEYSKKIDSAQSIDEAMSIFEENFDEFNNISEGFKKGILEFGENLLTTIGMLNLKLLVPPELAALYMHISEYRVMTHHLFKVSKLASYALEDRLSYEIDLASCLFTKLEERVKELKSDATTKSTENISIKTINKKIVKYKRIFDYKTLNKIAEQAGFEKVRQKGDHGIFKGINGDTIVIPQGRNIGKGLSCKIQKNIIQSSEEEMVISC